MTVVNMGTPAPIEYVVPMSEPPGLVRVIATEADRRSAPGGPRIDPVSVLPALRFRNVSKTFREHGRVIPALSDVSIEVGQGEIVALIGPNGAGKTTLIKILCGLVLPDQGSVLLDGCDTGTTPLARRSLGVVMEGDRDFYGMLSVAENLTYFAGLMGVPGREIGGRVAAALARFGLVDLAGRQGRRLSRGQKQRLSLALGMLHDPRYLILDEPTLGLDPLALEELLALMKDLRGAGVGILVASHDLAALEKVADRAIILSGGTIRHQTRLDVPELKAGGHDGLLDMFKRHVGMPQGEVGQW
ncbi:ATP-binding cassette domain-containing protein [Niveispirillum sp. SYP-B3756]|uniref:ABC transporter ATP-binding protein n=1 Tax=Niveispirillum sp. SYP-B3756 TaxID=2662178 RepID=UPI001291CBD2|nr:ABC transporter ATP-binding protein [Niveispirillum sp. SYP-B3756]MQP67540.1 ATP-binding cassette domain-containing protein [Niveispirillum sp. SYP-B3756]